MPELESARKHGESLLERIEPLKRQREAVIHGSLRSVMPENGVFYFSKLDWDKEKSQYEMAIEEFDLLAFPEFSISLERLALDALALHAEIQKTLLP